MKTSQRTTQPSQLLEIEGNKNMNINKETLVYAICTLGLMLFPACLEVHTTSQINADGTILRTITFDDDSASIYRGKFAVPLDSLWHRTIQKVDSKTFRLTATRLFHDVDEMNLALQGTFGKTLQYHFEYEKSFLWFFTVYRFKESNLKYNQFESIPLTDYVSQYEIDRQREHEVEKKPFVSKGDSLSLMAAGERFEEWAKRNLFEAVFTAFLDGVRKLNNPRLDVQAVEEHKDTLFQCSEKNLGNIDTLRIIFLNVLNNRLVDKAWYASSAEFKVINNKINSDFGGTYITSIVMPGLVTASNAPTIEGNKATWRDFKDYAKYLGYTMWIESKQVNWWAVILTGVIVVMLAILLVVSALKRRRFA